jgi:meso-butanediol dehydrogenase/(S,S)-butanediol dehydrogenase/diacetyl reductase
MSGGRLERRRALVVGAGRRRGIGAAIALRMQEEGATVTVADLASAGELEEVARLVGDRPGLACDVRDEHSVTQLFATHRDDIGPLDVVVYSVGVGDVIEPLVDLSTDRFDEVIAVNLRGAFLVFRAAAKEFARTGTAGRIMAVSSIGGRRGSPLLAAYNASKHGLIGLVRSVAAELGPTGTTVNALCPNHITTDMGAAQNTLLSGLRELELDDYREQMRQRIPLRRFATTDDVAATACFLASAEGAFITGAALDINGGELMG